MGPGQLDKWFITERGLLSTFCSFVDKNTTFCLILRKNYNKNLFIANPFEHLLE